MRLSGYVFPLMKSPVKDRPQARHCQSCTTSYFLTRLPRRLRLGLPQWGHEFHPFPRRLETAAALDEAGDARNGDVGIRRRRFEARRRSSSGVGEWRRISDSAGHPCKGDKVSTTVRQGREMSGRSKELALGHIAEYTWWLRTLKSPPKKQPRDTDYGSRPTRRSKGLV